jgi:uroporphyrinogen-III synthase
LVSERHPDPAFGDALRAITIAARGPKPAAALRELGVPVTVNAPEPNTWRELLTALEGRPEKRIFVQEYGRPNEEFVAALRERGADVMPVHIYNWELPEDREPLRDAVRRIAGNQADVVLFTTSAQVFHLFLAAREMGQEAPLLDGLRRVMVASIGPTTSETLREHKIEPDLEASHPRMGYLVREAAQTAILHLDRKRAHEAGR